MSSAARSTQMAMRITRHFAAFASLAVPVLAAESASADVIYHVYNTVIPNNIDGLYVNVQTFVMGSAAGLVP